MRIVDILVLRPSQDLGRMARKFEPRLPTFFRYLTRGLGTNKTASPDLLSLILFQNDYIQALIDLGERDAIAQADSIGRFLERPLHSDSEARPTNR
jgi:NTE family protein